MANGAAGRLPGFFLGNRTRNREHWPDPQVDTSLKAMPLLSHTVRLAPYPNLPPPKTAPTTGMQE